jgi:hypothetical protein
LKTNIERLATSERLKSKKIKKLQHDNWRLKKRISNLQGIVNSLKGEKILKKQVS